MDPLSIGFVVEASAGRLAQGSADALVRRVSSDSRKVEPGDLFAAIPGDRFDGHQFLAEVAQRGAAAVLVERGRSKDVPPTCAVIEVADVRVALGRLGARYRAQLKLRAVAVAGSNGKTTTKELIASVLRQARRTVWSEASFNNDLGVPFTLLRLDHTTEAAVLELGTNHPGELGPLVDMAQPQIGVITSIGREHLEFFGDLAGVAEEEGTLAARLLDRGVLILDGDSEWTPTLARRAQCRIVRVGWNTTNTFQLGSVSLGASGTTFELVKAPGGFAGDYSLGLLGRHQALNAGYAIAVAAEFGLSPAQVRQGLAECAPPKSRLKLTECAGISLLDDSYNANADSMIAAVKTLAELLCSGKRVAVIGDMAELGAHTEAAHREVGAQVAALNIDLLVAVGTQASATVAGAQGRPSLECQAFAGADVALTFLHQRLRPGDVVLIKASRSARLDQLAEGLLQRAKT